MIGQKWCIVQANVETEIDEARSWIYGADKAIYSWRLNHNDATPVGKKRTLSLRELEKQIQLEKFDHIAAIWLSLE